MEAYNHANRMRMGGREHTAGERAAPMAGELRVV
jgi:hypothetical protein